MTFWVYAVSVLLFLIWLQNLTVAPYIPHSPLEHEDKRSWHPVGVRWFPPVQKPALKLGQRSCWLLVKKSLCSQFHSLDHIDPDISGFKSFRPIWAFFHCIYPPLSLRKAIFFPLFLSTTCLGWACLSSLLHPSLSLGRLSPWLFSVVYHHNAQCPPSQHLFESGYRCFWWWILPAYAFEFSPYQDNTH